MIRMAGVEVAAVDVTLGVLLLGEVFTGLWPLIRGSRYNRGMRMVQGMEGSENEHLCVGLEAVEQDQIVTEHRARNDVADRSRAAGRDLPGAIEDAFEPRAEVLDGQRGAGRE
jgi:hypothetical protein